VSGSFTVGDLRQEYVQAKANWVRATPQSRALSITHTQLDIVLGAPVVEVLD
jgi:hypothetical protein